jgi:ribosomal RNA-processing protein 17
VNALLRPAIESDISQDSGAEYFSGEEWNGVEDVTPPPIDHEAEYIDEGKYTTVTVEAVDVSKEGLHKAEEQARQDPSDPESGTKVTTRATTTSASERVAQRGWTKEKPKDKPDKPKKKRKKFRYEGKAERKFTRMKEKSKNRKQAKTRRAG